MDNKVQLQQLVVDTKTINLSTRSTAGTILNTIPDYKSQIQFNIPDAIVMDDSIEFIHFSIPYAIIPNSFYTINQTNNVLVVVENGVTTNYTFPQGNYNSDSFIAAWTAVMPIRFSLFINPVTNIFTITNNTYAFQILDSSIDYIMGFSQSMTSTGSVLFQIVMTRPCNFMPSPRINLRCNLLANSIMTGSVVSSDVILSIPNSGTLNGEIVYQNVNPQKCLFKLDKLSSFVVSITDDDGNLINFNGISSFFTFQFDIYRRTLEKSPDFHKTVLMVNNNSSRELSAS